MYHDYILSILYPYSTVALKGQVEKYYSYNNYFAYATYYFAYVTYYFVHTTYYFTGGR